MVCLYSFATNTPFSLWAHEKSARPSSSWDEARMRCGKQGPRCVSLYHPAQRLAHVRSPRTRLARDDGHPGDAYWAPSRVPANDTPHWGRSRFAKRYGWQPFGPRLRGDFRLVARTWIPPPQALFSVRVRHTRPHQRLWLDMIARGETRAMEAHPLTQRLHAAVRERSGQSTTIAGGRWCSCA